MLHVSLVPLREQVRARCRGLLVCMLLSGVLFVLALAPIGGYRYWSDAVFIGFCCGVPSGLILYPAYRFVKFAIGH